MGFLEDYKNKKWEKDYKRAVANRKKALLTKLGLPKDATQEDINNAIVQYAQKDNSILSSIFLDTAQTSDTEFMMKLYRCNNFEFFLLYPPKTDDTEYLIEYLKIRNSLSGDKYPLRFVLENIPNNKFKDVNFLQALAEAFPEENILDISYYHIVRFSTPNLLAEFSKIIAQLPSEVLSSQAKNFGRGFLARLPKNIDGYTQYVSNAIEHDDFNSLSYLSPEELISHKDLISKAVEISKKNKTFSSERLNNFFNRTLYPIQQSSCVSNGDYHNYTYFNKQNLIATYNIANDEEFWRTLDIPVYMKNSLLTKMQETISNFTIKNPTTETTDTPNM
ncbi:MAG: hypothetical protein ACI4PF_06120 [Christensenellales bacterium]